MSLDVLNEINAAEQAAQQQKDAFLAEMKARQAQVEANGRALLEQVRAHADTDRKAALKHAEEEAAVYARQVAERLETDGAALRAGAESRMEAAAEYIVERIVSG